MQSMIGMLRVILSMMHHYEQWVNNEGESRRPVGQAKTKDGGRDERRRGTREVDGSKEKNVYTVLINAAHSI